jgi:hypothetical protein
VAWRPCHAGLALLNRSREQLEEEKPPYPWPFAGQGRWRSRPTLGGASDARWRGRRVFSLSRGRTQPRAHAPVLGVRAGWAVRPRPAPHALVRWDRRRKAGSVTRRGW